MADTNIPGVGGASHIANIETEAINKVTENEKINTENEKLPSSDENEQVEFDCTDGKDDGKISFGEALNIFFKDFKSSIKNIFGKKSGWQDIAERKQELIKQKQAVDQKAADMGQKWADLNHEIQTNPDKIRERLENEIQHAADKTERENEYDDKISDEIINGGNLHLE